ncbi:MAG: DUF4870 domain-containing protein [Planctomycetota bacterium]|nr:DUF4870 domain-containing protein [Planctomycetota bacterium]
MNIELEGEAGAAQPGLTKDERTWGMLAHLLALSGYVVPLGNIIGPMVVYFVKKDESEFVKQEAKESLNFQISVFLYMIVSAVLIIVLIGILLLIAVGIWALVMVILASIKANEGKPYRYPFTIRFIS